MILGRWSKLIVSGISCGLKWLRNVNDNIGMMTWIAPYKVAVWISYDKFVEVKKLEDIIVIDENDQFSI